MVATLDADVDGFEPGLGTRRLEHPRTVASEVVAEREHALRRFAQAPARCEAGGVDWLAQPDDLGLDGERLGAARGAVVHRHEGRHEVGQLGRKRKVVVDGMHNEDERRRRVPGSERER